MVALVVASVVLIALAAVIAYVIMGTWITAAIAAVAMLITLSVSIAAVFIVKYLKQKRREEK